MANRIENDIIAIFIENLKKKKIFCLFIVFFLSLLANELHSKSRCRETERERESVTITEQNSS